MRGSLVIDILRFHTRADPSNEGLYRRDLERGFPSSNIGSPLARLVKMGVLEGKGEQHGTSVWTVYVRTGRGLGPDRKLDAFMEVEA